MATVFRIEDDLVDVVKAIATREKRPVAAVANDLLRKGLPKVVIGENDLGLPVLHVPGSKVVITTELVNSLREDDD
jgi:hypothetical protein